MRSRRTILPLLVLVGGGATMGVEMCASRLLAPYFGNSLPVWGAVIGLLLAYLAVGSAVGGRLADRQPEAALLYKTAAWAGFTVGLVPLLAQPILRYSVVGFSQYRAGPVLGSLIGILALFAVPVVLLGCISPFAVRLSVESASDSGRAAGRIYALSTAGSLVGTFTTVFLLIPNVGTRRTILTISVSVMLIAIVGLFQDGRRKALPYLLLLAAILVLQFLPLGAIRRTEGLIYETDSAYNYIQVIRQGEEIVLKLNEGEGIQSTYKPDQVLTGYFYDYFLLAPFFRRQEHRSTVDSLCVIGLAAGTTARQYSATFGSIPIDGVEIDPAVVDAGQRYFDMNLPNLEIIVEDGRYFLAHSQRHYDVILVDAYNPPYIPFQLTTAEFFREVDDHLTPDGVLAINVARTEIDYALVNAIASTLHTVYPSVYVMDMLGNLNSIVLASRQPTALDVVKGRLARQIDPILTDVVARASGRMWEFTQPTGEPLTDDRAPIEQMVHAMVARYFLGQPIEEVRE